MLGHEEPAEFDLTKPSPSPNLPLQKITGEDDQTPVSLEVPIGSMKNSSSRPALSRSASSVPSFTIDSPQASPRVPSGPLDEPEVTVESRPKTTVKSPGHI